MGLTSNQILCIQLLNDGRKANEIAPVIGLSIAQIKSWGKDKVFMQERYNDMVLRFGEAVPRAMNVLFEIMDDRENKASDRIKASTEVLDRAGFGVRKNVDVTITEARPTIHMSDDEIRHALEVIEKGLDAIDVTPEEVLEIGDNVCDNTDTDV